MIYLLIIWFLWYPLLVWSRWGVLSSISASSYLWEGNQKIWFISWLVGLGVLVYWLDMGFYSHLMALGFTIAGMSPDHKRRAGSVEDEYHTAGTVVAIASGFAGLFFVYGVWIPTAVFVAGVLLFYLTSKNWIWWTELLAGLSISAGFIMA